MSYYFGLYFGNTNFCIAVDRNGKSEVLANSAGDRLTPAVVSVVNDETCVGLAAKQCMMRNAGESIIHVKSLLADNKCFVNDDDEIAHSTVQNGNAQQLKPYESLVLLFKNMVSIARSHCHETDVPVVVTVPVNFSLKLKKIVESAATEAGFRLLRIITESSAAALAYDLGQDSSNSDFNCLIYRLGGNSIDVTIYKVFGGVYQLLASMSRKDLGGNLFTEKLVDFVANEFQRRYKVDVRENRRTVKKLHSAAETCKHALSIMRSAQCFAESIYDGIDLNFNVSQARFESLINSDLVQCLEIVTETLDEACLTENEISKIVLAGGSSKIPKVQQLFTEKFSSGTVLTSISPDEVIALGAAKEATLVSHERPLTDLDCYISTLSNSIFLRKIEDSEDKSANLILLFRKGVPVPASSQVPLSSNKELTVSFEICEQQNETDEDKYRVLGKFTTKLTEEMSLEAEIAQDRALKLSCRDIVTGLSKLLII